MGRDKKKQRVHQTLSKICNFKYSIAVINNGHARQSKQVQEDKKLPLQIYTLSISLQDVFN